MLAFAGPLCESSALPRTVLPMSVGTIAYPPSSPAWNAGAADAERWSWWRGASDRARRPLAVCLTCAAVGGCAHTVVDRIVGSHDPTPGPGAAVPDRPPMEWGAEPLPLAGTATYGFHAAPPFGVVDPTPGTGDVGPDSGAPHRRLGPSLRPRRGGAGSSPRAPSMAARRTGRGRLSVVGPRPARAGRGHVPRGRRVRDAGRRCATDTPRTAQAPPGWRRGRPSSPCYCLRGSVPPAQVPCPASPGNPWLWGF